MLLATFCIKYALRAVKKRITSNDFWELEPWKLCRNVGTFYHTIETRSVRMNSLQLQNVMLCAQMTLHKKSSFVVWLLIWSVKNQELQQWHISLLTWNHRRETWEFSWWLHNYHVTLLPAWALQVCYVCCKIYKEENGKILSAQKGQNPINWKENWQKTKEAFLWLEPQAREQR